MIDTKRHDDTPAAPGDLEVLQRFLNLHDHASGLEADLPPAPDMVRTFLLERGLLAADSPYGEAEHARAMRLFRAIHARLRAQDAGEPLAPHLRAIEEVAGRAGLRPRFVGRPGLEPSAGGIDAALGRLVAVLFLAELDGRWGHMKECASSTCTAVYYDRSKNHTGKWCSMRSCGNKHKVRAWRERNRPDVVHA